MGTTSQITSTLPSTPSPSCICDLNSVKTTVVPSGYLRFIIGVVLGVGLPSLIALSLILWKVCGLYHSRSKYPPSSKLDITPFDTRPPSSIHTSSFSKRSFTPGSTNGNSLCYTTLSPSLSVRSSPSSFVWESQGYMPPDSLTCSRSLWSSSNTSGVGGSSRPPSVARSLGTPVGLCDPSPPPGYSLYQTPPPSSSSSFDRVSTCPGLCVHNSLSPASGM